MPILQVEEAAAGLRGQSLETESETSPLQPCSSSTLYRKRSEGHEVPLHSTIHAHRPRVITIHAHGTDKEPDNRNTAIVHINNVLLPIERLDENHLRSPSRAYVSSQSIRHDVSLVPVGGRACASARDAIRRVDDARDAHAYRVRARALASVPGLPRSVRVLIVRRRQNNSPQPHVYSYIVTRRVSL